ncbi:Prolyl-tRNA_synthetase [Hexamita inflata]|uniref:Prolyl-tRNA synthetase n=1 Tax=Hexamita inflata TaxID=28002 RepID=A0AA86QM48_9EUKA|nr:Prolyl-tRNA synthetase [Hexamita inflata]
MNYEDQMFKQLLEQPDYIPAEYMSMQRAGAIKYTNMGIHFGPIFMNQVNQMKTQLENELKAQQVQLQIKQAEDLSLFVQAVRSAKALPLVMSNGLYIENNTQNRSKTVVDQDLFFIGEEISAQTVLQKFQQLGGQIIPTFHGAVLAQAADQQVEQIEATQPADETENELEKIHTPNVHTMQELEDFLQIPKSKMLKLVLYQFKGKLIFIFIRGDLNVSTQKLSYVLGLNCYENQLQMASTELINQHGIVEGFGGLYNAQKCGQMTILFDNSVKGMKNCVIGGNQIDYHYKNYNYERDNKKEMKMVLFADLVENQNVPKGILVEAHEWIQKVPLMNSAGKIQEYKMITVRIRWLDVLAQIQKFNAAYSIVQVLPKFEEQFKQYQELVQKIKTINVIDERPKVTFGQKKDTAMAGVFNKIYMFNKNMGPEGVDVMVFENGAWVEKKEIL